MDQEPNKQDAQKSRLEGLHANRAPTEQGINKSYSSLIHKVKIILPIIALILVVVMVGWNKFEGDKIVPIKEEDIQPEIKQEIGKNELLNPRFESMDDKQQPFTLTADRAVQEDGENGEMILENPAGKMSLNSGEKVTLKAKNGSYKQIEQSLSLNENVNLGHSQGYTLTTQTLNIDLKSNKAWSNKDVHVTGPQGEIKAAGIDASNKEEILIFKGPATMTLQTQENTINIGEMLP